MRSPVRILHVDDDPAFAALAADALERADDRFEVITESDADAALERLAEAEIDCVVSDYRMPGTDGIEFLRAFRRRFPDHPAPFVLLTGEGDEGVAAAALHAGASSYVRKGADDVFASVAERIRNDLWAARAERDGDRFETLVEAMSDPVYVLDETGRFTFVNDAFLELTGHDRATVLGGGPELIKDSTAVATGERNLAKLLSSDGPDAVTFEVEIETRDGRTVPCEDHMGVLPYEGDRFVGSIGVLRDVSEWTGERYRSLRRERDRLEEFTRIVSHDLRNPLTVARGHVDLAAEHDDLSGAVPDHLAESADALDRATELLDDLLGLARRGEVVDDLVPVDLAEVAAEAWDHVRTGSASLSVELSGIVDADRTRLATVFENLYRNAVEHGGPEVTVRVGALEPGGDPARGFYVADDGPGIPDEERDRVFDSGVTTADEGTGFGLAIVADVVEAHGWDVDLTESASGGARFEIHGGDRPLRRAAA